MQSIHFDLWPDVSNHGSFICTVILSQLLVSQDNNTGQFQAVYTERGFHIR